MDPEAKLVSYMSCVVRREIYLNSPGVLSRNPVCSLRKVEGGVLRALGKNTQSGKTEKLLLNFSIS